MPLFFVLVIESSEKSDIISIGRDNSTNILKIDHISYLCIKPDMRDFEENRCLILLNCSGGLERFTEIDTDTVLHVNSIIKFGDAGFLRDIFYKWLGSEDFR